MSEKKRKLLTICAVVGLVMLVSGTAEANWEESFGGNDFDLTTWLFRAYPEITGTFSVRYSMLLVMPRGITTVWRRG